MPNIALNKPALQSSTCEWSVHADPAADAAIANNGDRHADKFCHTAFEREPWWQVDLGDLYLIRSVTIHNRRDHKGRLTNFSVLRSCDGRDWVECAKRSSAEVFARLTLDLAGENIARFVRIRLNGTAFLHMRECEVVGEACSPETSQRLLEAEQAALSRRNFIPEGRAGEIVELGGFHIFVDSAYGPDVQAALRQGGYERIEREMAREFLRPGDRVLEAGCAVGVVSMTAAAVVGADNVMTFDANPCMIEDARANFARNGLERISAVHGLLANRRRFTPGSSAKFGVASEFWASRLASGDDSHFASLVDAPFHCLEDEIESFKANVLICDIEGGEVDLLPESDLAAIRLIVLETHYWARGEAATDAMIARLTQMGFAIHLGASRQQVVVMRRREDVR